MESTGKVFHLLQRRVESRRSRAAKSRIGGEEGGARAAGEVEEEFSTNCYDPPNLPKRQKQLTTSNHGNDMIIGAMIMTETSSTAKKMILF